MQLVVMLIVKYLMKVSNMCLPIKKLHYKSITFTPIGPDMFDLVKVVIPRIMWEWEYIAEALRYDLATIEGIKEKERENPKRCCREFFKDWLTTNNGAKAGPKTWSTLLDVLKEVDEISSDSIEDIIEKVKQL